MKEIGPMAWKHNMIWVQLIVDWQYSENKTRLFLSTVDTFFLSVFF